MNLAKLFLLLVTFFVVSANAAKETTGRGNEGGGGHPCKDKFNELFLNMKKAFDEVPELKSKYPDWEKLVNVMLPEKNPGFEIVIKESPIQGCNKTENALACAKPKSNTIELYCGEKGWDSLALIDQYKYLIHELYWFSSRKDANFHYSTMIADDVLRYFHIVRCTSSITMMTKLMKFYGEMLLQCDQIKRMPPSTNRDEYYRESQRITANTVAFHKEKVEDCKESCLNTSERIMSCEYELRGACL